MTTWPATLPQTFERRGYTEGSANNAIKTQMDAGPAKRRRRFTAGVYPMAGTMIMTSDQYEDLKTFFHDTILETLPFDFTHPRTGATISVKFDSEPKILEEWVPNRFRVQLQFEVQI